MPVVGVPTTAKSATFVPATSRSTYSTAVGVSVISVNVGIYLYTVTVLEAGVIVKAAGVATVTVTFSPFPTVMSDIFSVLIVPVPLRVPLVAPVTVMLLAVSEIGSSLKVNVNSVVGLVPEAPFAVNSVNVTGFINFESTEPVIVPPV